MFKNLQRLGYPRTRVSPQERNITRCVQEEVGFTEFHIRAAQGRIVAGPVELKSAIAKSNKIFPGYQAAGFFQSFKFLIPKSRALMNLCFGRYATFFT